MMIPVDKHVAMPIGIFISFLDNISKKYDSTLDFLSTLNYNDIMELKK